MRRLVFIAFLAFSLVGCDPSAYVQPDGSIAFDVQIRIAPPVIQPSPTPRPTIVPTITLQPTAAIAPTDDPTPTIEFVTPLPPRSGKVTAYSLKVRRCASQACEDDYLIFQGDVVYITNEAEVNEFYRIWYYIDVPGTNIEGWVAAAFIELDRG